MHAPLKKRYIRANNSPFMTKELCKAIMYRSRLRNKLLRVNNTQSREAYRKQRNYCVALLRKTKRNFYENMNVKLITDNRKFWKQVKPFFNDKKAANSNIILIEGNEIVSDNTKCAEIMNNFFSDAALNLDVDRNLNTQKSNAVDSVLKAIEVYKDHPSIIKINQQNIIKSSFNFQSIPQSLTLNIIKNLDSSKSYQKDNIPPKLLKDNKEICSAIITSDFSDCILKGEFPSNLKVADITPTFKKDDRLLKSNYRPISILPTLSKIFEKILYMQIYEYFNDIFSKYLCGFRKGHSTQHCLLFMLEKLRKYLDNGLKTGILLTDLSKAFGSISHSLILAKLNAYGFSKTSLDLINNYLSGRTQRTKIGDCFSSWREIVYGVPEGSILGPLLFNIYMNDLFLFSDDFNIANYADDSSPYEFSGSSEDVIRKLEKDAIILIEWYKFNYLKPNPDKWHLLLSDTTSDLKIRIDDECISNNSYVKILGVNFDNKLNFNIHVTK